MSVSLRISWPLQSEATAICQSKVLVFTELSAAHPRNTVLAMMASVQSDLKREPRRGYLKQGAGRYKSQLKLP